MADALAQKRQYLTPADWFSLVALVLLGTRFVQGFIFWGGASRRLVYDFHETAGVDLAVKLDFDGPGFVAAKLTHALPGALWLQGPIEWTLRHPDLVIASVWLWTFAELAVGLGLILGLMTRLAAFASIWLNVSLMLIFGWMGSTCLDEWTMAVSGVAMSCAVFLAGGGTLSLDRLIGQTGWSRRNPWTSWIFSGPVPASALRSLALCLAAATVVFTVGTYHLLFGAVVTPLQARVNFHVHNIALSPARHDQAGFISFDAYVDAGPDTGAVYVIAARLEDDAGRTTAAWDGAALAALPAEAFENAYPYVWASRFKAEVIGFSGQTGARATIFLPLPDIAAAGTPPGAASGGGSGGRIVLETIDGRQFTSRGR
jgi:uncharacterized membrane protein YphA (DoxX/SURF4 family)